MNNVVPSLGKCRVIWKGWVAARNGGGPPHPSRAASSSKKKTHNNPTRETDIYRKFNNEEAM